MSSLPSLFNLLHRTKQLDLATEYSHLLNRKDFILSKDFDRSKWDPLVLATWDDHDYGEDNLGKENIRKDEAKEEFMKFLGKVDGNKLEKEIKEMKERKGGIYYSKTYERKGVKICFLMMDVRWYRTSKNVLGEPGDDSQWLWLVNEINRGKKEEVDWFIIGVGTPFLLKHPNIISKIGGESWDESSKFQFLSILENAGIKNKTLILSGDVHFSVVHELDGLWEFTASSFTHSLDPISNWFVRKKYKSEPSQRKSDVSRVNGYGLLELTKTTWNYSLKSQKNTNSIFIQMPKPK